MNGSWVWVSAGGFLGGDEQAAATDAFVVLGPLPADCWIRRLRLLVYRVSAGLSAMGFYLLSSRVETAAEVLGGQVLHAGDPAGLGIAGGIPIRAGTTAVVAIDYDPGLLLEKGSYFLGCVDREITVVGNHGIILSCECQRLSWIEGPEDGGVSEDVD